MSATRDIVGGYANRISEVDGAEWNACFHDEAENHAYYSACEQGAVFAARGAERVAVAPVFSMTFRLDASFQADTRLLARTRRSLARWIGWPVIGLGSPFAERCHVGWRSGLTAAERMWAFDALIDALEERARVERTNLIAIKDVMAPFDGTFEEVLAERGYVRLSGLPIATLDLTGVSTLDEYFSQLSSATRKDVRRKLRSAATVRVEECHDITPYAAQVSDLYESTRAESGLDYGDFEKLPPGYFLKISAALGERALFKLYWVGETLAAFNLLLIEPDRVIDKFLGMRYPLAREHHLYALSWVENVRHCLAIGTRTLQTGQTAYREKLRMGSELVPTAIWFRHRGAVVQRVLRTLAPLASFERNDPQLAAASARHGA